MKKYMVLSEYDYSALEYWLNVHAQQGWRIVGPVQVTSDAGSIRLVATMELDA